MEGYASNQANRSFVTFFLLNARLLLSMRLNFYSKRFLTDEHVEQQKKKFQVDKWASKRARLLFTISCRHPEINFFAQDVDFMDQTDPFDCDCRKQCWSKMLLPSSIWILTKPDEQLTLVLLYSL